MRKLWLIPRWLLLYTSRGLFSYYGVNSTVSIINNNNNNNNSNNNNNNNDRILLSQNNLYFRHVIFLAVSRYHTPCKVTVTFLEYFLVLVRLSILSPVNQQSKGQRNVLTKIDVNDKGFDFNLPRKTKSPIEGLF